MAEGKPVEQPASVIYFREDSGTMAKGLGLRIRDQGALTRLVWAHLFKGPDQIIDNAGAVVIETAAPNASLIARSYERFAHDVEIHYVDSDGKFVEEPDNIREERRANSVIQTDTIVDPKAALASLAAAEPEPEPEPDPPKFEPANEQDPAGEVSGEDGPSEPEVSDTVGGDGVSEGTEHDSGVRSEEVPSTNDSD